jgi:putative glutamine amidotransferase
MRVERDPATGESRDALAHDWPVQLRRALGPVAWVGIPNLGVDVTRFLTTWEIEAVILTGGNDVGSCPRRDETEQVVLAHCAAHALPVLGVCRGLHVMQVAAGGSLHPVGTHHHRGAHAVTLLDARARALAGRARADVNSFHRYGVTRDDLAPELEAWAVSDDGLVEGLRHRARPQVAVQWHPERPSTDPELARRLLWTFYAS